MAVGGVGNNPAPCCTPLPASSTIPPQHSRASGLLLVRSPGTQCTIAVCRTSVSQIPPPLRPVNEAARHVFHIRGSMAVGPAPSSPCALHWACGARPTSFAHTLIYAFTPPYTDAASMDIAAVVRCLTSLPTTPVARGPPAVSAPEPTASASGDSPRSLSPLPAAPHCRRDRCVGPPAKRNPLPPPPSRPPAHGAGGTAHRPAFAGAPLPPSSSRLMRPGILSGPPYPLHTRRRHAHLLQSSRPSPRAGSGRDPLRM